MTDAEIIKALECCTDDSNGVTRCEQCPYQTTDLDYCIDDLLEQALSLINRQKAELDDLKRDDLPRCKDALRRANEMGMALEMENEALKVEIERLQADYTRACAARDARICTNNFIRAEAIKEFADRLKEKQKQINITYNLDYDVVFVSEIDNLVKEMVGDGNENL